MRLKTLQLVNFRNYDNLHINFNEKEWDNEIPKLDADLKICAAIITQSMSHRSAPFHDLQTEFGKTLGPRFTEM